MANRHAPNKTAKRIKDRFVERKIIEAAPSVPVGELPETEVNKAAAMTWEDKVMEEVKHSVPLDVVKKQFAKKRRDGRRAF